MRKLYEKQDIEPGQGNAKWILLPDGTYRGVSVAESRKEVPIPEGARLYFPDNLQSQGAAAQSQTLHLSRKDIQPWKQRALEGKLPARHG